MGTIQKKYISKPDYMQMPAFHQDAQKAHVFGNDFEQVSRHVDLLIQSKNAP